MDYDNHKQQKPNLCSIECLAWLGTMHFYNELFNVVVTSKFYVKQTRNVKPGSKPRMKAKSDILSVSSCWPKTAGSLDIQLKNRNMNENYNTHVENPARSVLRGFIATHTRLLLACLSIPLPGSSDHFLITFSWPMHTTLPKHYVKERVQKIQ